MEENQNAKNKCKIITKIQTHKKEFIILGSCVALGACGYLLYRYRSKESEQMNDALLKLLEKEKTTENTIEYSVIQSLQIPKKTVCEDVKPISMDKIPIEVNMHIRNLHRGWKASPEKTAYAAEMGIELLPGQTWVAPFVRSAA